MTFLLTLILVDERSTAWGQDQQVTQQAQQTDAPNSQPVPDRAIIVEQPTTPTHRRIYIPTEELDLLIERDRKGVLLPRGEFEELFDLAEQNAKKAKPASADFVLSRVTYDARLDGSLMRITAQVEFSQYTDDWVSIPLSVGALSVEKATLKDQPARLGRHPEDRNTLLLLNRETGKHLLELQLSIEVASTGVEKLTTLTLPQIPVGTLVLHLDAGQHLLVDGLSLARPADHDEPADYNIPVGGRSDISLRVTDRPSEQTTDALVFATTAYGVQVSPGEITWTTKTSLQVFGQPINRLTFTIPKPLEIADVVSPGLEAWELTDDDEGEPSTILTLSYRQPIRGERTINLRGVMTTPTDETWTVPTLTIDSITSHIGRMLIRYPAGVRLQVADIQGARPSEKIANLPEGDEAFSQALMYDVWKEDFSIQFLTQQKQREMQAALSTILDVNNTGADLQVAATVESRFAPLFELEIQIPSEWVVRDVTMNGQPIKWQNASNEASVNELRIPIQPPLQPGQEATFILAAHRDLENWPVETESAMFALPEVKLPQAGVVEGTYIVRADDDLDVAPNELTGLDPVYLQLPGERLGYRYQDTHFSGNLEVTRKPTRLSVQSVIHARIDRQTWFTSYQTTINSQGGGTKTLEISLAENLGTDLRFELLYSAARIVEQIPAAPSEGTIVWTLRFDRRLQGEFTLAVDAERPRGEGAAEIALSPIKVIGADRQNGYIAWEAGEDQQLHVKAADDRGEPLMEVDPLELPPSQYIPRERIVSVYRYVAPDYTMSASEQRFDKHAVPTAVCHSANLDSILGETGEWQHRAIYQISATSVQSLEVKLPDAELWAAIIDGNPTEVRKVRDGFSISLPTSVDADATRVIELYYRNQTDELKTFGKLRQQVPALAIVGGSGAAQPLTILEQGWSVHYPDQVLLIESDGRFEPVDPLDRPSLLGQLQTRMTRLTIADVLQKAPVLGIVGFVALLLTLAARKRRLWMFIGSMVVLMLLFSFMLPAVQQSREAARRTQAQNDMRQRELDMRGGVATGAAAPTAAATPAESPAWLAAGEAAEEAAPELPADEKGEAAATKSDRMDVLRDMQKDLIESESMNRAKQPVAGFAPPKGREPAPNDQSEFSSMGRDQSGNEALLAESDDDATPNNAKLNHYTSQLSLDIRQTQTVDGPGPGRMVMGGLLSLTIPFHPPQGSLTKTFRYLGDQLGSESTDLEFSYEDRETRYVFRTFLALLVLVPFWMLRRRSASFRVLYIALGIAVSLALIPIVPVRWQIYLDGLFLGSICSIVLMLVCSLICCCRSTGCSWSAFRRKMSTKLWSCLLPLTILAGQAFIAADAQAQQNAQPNAAAQNEVGENAEVTTPPTRPIPPISRDLNVYFPYEPGTDPLAAERVFLPYETFVRLWNAAHPDEKIDDVKTASAMITEAIYSAKLSSADNAPSTVVTVNARLAIYLVHEGQTMLTLPLRNIALRSAKLNGETAAILAPTDDVPRHRLSLSTSGLNVLDLEFDLPIKLAGEAGQFTLALDPVASGRLSFALPAAELNVRVNGSKTVYRLRTENETTFVDLPIDQGGDVTLAWQPEESRGMVDTTVLTETTSAVSLDDSGLTVSQGFDFSIKQGSISELTFTMPEPLRLRRIDGVDVGGWEIQGLDTERKLRLFLRRKVNDRTQLQIEFFHETDVTEEMTTLDIPLCVPQDVTRETGTIGIFSENQFTLRMGPVEGLQQTEVNQYREVVPLRRLSNSPQTVYRYRQPIPALSLQMARRKPESRVHAEHGVFIARRKQHLTSHLRYDLTGAPRSVLPIRMPQGYLVLEVFASGLVDWSQTISASGDAQILLVELDGPKTGTVEVVLNGTVPRDPSDPTTALDVPYPLEVSRYEAFVGLWVDNIYTAQLKEFFGWKSISPDQLPQQLKQRNNIPVQLAFTAEDPDPDLILVDLIQEQPAMTADSLSVVTVSEIAVTYALAMQWKITKAAADTFQFTTPGWLKGKLDFQIGGLRQVTRTELPDERIRWTVTLQDAVHEKLFLTAIATLPPSTEGEALLPALEFEQSPINGDEADALALETQRHYVLTVNQSQNQLAPLDENLVELVSREEVPLVIPDDIARQATQIVRLKQPQTAPVLSLRRFEETKAVTASVNLLELTSVVERNGSWRTAAIYRIKNRSRQFLALWIPDEARILSVFVQDQASRPVETKRHERTMYLIPLPKVSEADLSIGVKVVLGGTLAGGPLPRGFRISAKEIDLPAPQVVSMQEDPEYGLPVAQTQWTVYLPDDLEIVPVDDLNRHNLELLDERQPALAQEEWLYREASELVKVLDNSGNYRSKQQAYNNLKEIQRNLDRFEYQRQQETVTMAQPDVEKKLDEQRKSLDDLIGKNSFLVEQDNDASIANDDVLQFRQLQEQSQSLIMGNSISGIAGLDMPSDESKLPISNYSEELIPQEELKDKQNKAPSKAGGKSVQSQSRARRMSQSRDNLGDLNMILEEKKEQSAAQMDFGQPGWGTFGGGMGGMGGGFGMGGGGFGGGNFEGGGIGGAAPPQGQRFGGLGGLPLSMGNKNEVNNFNAPAQGLGIHSTNGDYVIADQGFALAPWTQRGGLSLPIDIPTAGQKLVFGKVTGSPKLALSVRTRESVSTGIGVVWMFVWLGVAGALFLCWFRYGQISLVMHRLPEILLVIGIAGYLLMPGKLSLLSLLFLLLFVAGAFSLGMRYRKTSATAV